LGLRAGQLAADGNINDDDKTALFRENDKKEIIQNI